MRKFAETEIKILIKKVRGICIELDDCPIMRAREPNQLDCITCIIQDAVSMKEKLKIVREFVEKQGTIYGTSITKLEVALDSSLLPDLKKQMEAKK